MAAGNGQQPGEDMVKCLRQCASLNNRSMEGGIRHILECAANDHMAAKHYCIPEGIGPAMGGDRKYRCKARLGQIEVAVASTARAALSDMPNAGAMKSLRCRHG